MMAVFTFLMTFERLMDGCATSDDINKFLWMVHIGGVFPRIKEPDYLREGQYRIDSQATPTMLNCLMYKLSYYRFVETDGKGFDRVRRTEIGKKYIKLTHFEEVFTTHHWMVRIYKLKSPKNRIRGKTKKLKDIHTSYCVLCRLLIYIFLYVIHLFTSLYILFAET